jgi:hypothetical protein
VLDPSTNANYLKNLLPPPKSKIWMQYAAKENCKIKGERRKEGVERRGLAFGCVDPYKTMKIASYI